MAKLKFKNYGSLAEYWFPHRPEYEALVRLRIKLFDADFTPKFSFNPNGNLLSLKNGV